MKERLQKRRKLLNQSYRSAAGKEELITFDAAHPQVFAAIERDFLRKFPGHDQLLSEIVCQCLRYSPFDGDWAKEGF